MAIDEGLLRDRRRAAWRVVGPYLLTATVWIALADPLLSRWFGDGPGQTLANLAEGLVFMGITGAGLWSLVGRAMRQTQQALARERQARAAEHQARQLLQTVIDSLPEVVFAKDEAGRFTLLNAEAARHLGREPDELLGQPWRPAEGEPAHPLWSRAVVASGRHQGLVLQAPARTGEPVRTWRIDEGPLLCPPPQDGADLSLPPPSGRFVVAQDISERLRAEQQLQDNERRHRLLFEHSPQPMWVHDRETLRFLAVNDAAVQRYGHARAAFLRLSLRDLQPVMAGSACPVGVIGEAGAGAGATVGSIKHRGLWQHRRADGGVIEVELSTSDLEFDHRPARLVVAHDVSVREAALRELEQTRRELSALAQRMLRQEHSTQQALAHTLHDHVGHGLVLLGLQLDELDRQWKAPAAEAAAGAGGSVPGAPPSPTVPTLPTGAASPAARAQLDGARLRLQETLQTVRDLLAGLSPAQLDERGLATAMQAEIARLQTDVPQIDLLAEIDERLLHQRWPHDVELALFMIFREALANAVRHAGPSLVRVLLDGGPAHCRLAVIDDGIGMPTAGPGGPSSPPGHLGLAGMRERALAIAADFRIRPAYPMGTRVDVLWSDKA